MKKVRLFYMLFAWLLVTACEDDETEFVAGVVYDVTEQEFVIGSEGGTAADVFINSNTPWTLTGATDWCTFSPESGGEGSTRVHFTLTENTDYDDRNVLLTLAVGDQKTLLNVTQKQKDAVIASADKEVFGQEGGEMRVSIQSNIQYVVTIPEESAEWIMQKESVSSKAMENTELVFTIAANENPEGRLGYVIVEDESKFIPDTVKVFQSQKDQLVLLSTERRVPLQGLDIEVELRTNIQYDVIVEEAAKDWLHVIDNDREDVLCLKIDEWKVESNAERRGIVTIKDKNSDLQQIFTVIQAPEPTVIVTPLTAEVPQSGGQAIFNVQTNVGYKVEMSERLEWVRLVDSPNSKAMENHSLVFEVDPNPEGELPRFATIIIRDGENNSIENKLSINQAGRERMDDKDVLRAMYDALGMEDLAVIPTSWDFDNKDDLNSYNGVDANADNKITALNLNGMFFRGMKGELPACIGDLEYLETLEIEASGVVGAIPAELGRLKNLKKLVLIGGFTSIPEELWQLENLETLELQMASADPLDFISELTNLNSLVIACEHTGEFPAVFGKLRNLKTLSIGVDDKISKFTSLPQEIGQLTNLETLTLIGGLEGELTSGIGNLSNLKTLTIDTTNLTALPAEIGNLSTLNTLTIERSTLTNLPAEIGNLSALTALTIIDNELTALPTEIGNLTVLKTMNLSNNKIAGEIPSTFGNLSALTSLNMSNNRLTAIPYEMGASMLALQTLNLSNNQLEGLVSSFLFNMPALKVLNLSNNQLSGTIPGEIINVSATLQELYLQNNKLNGELPATALGSLSLKKLNLENNNLSGSIPENFYGGSSKNFTSSFGNECNLNGNRLSGDIPDPILEELLEALESGRTSFWKIVDQQEGYGFDNWKY